MATIDSSVKMATTDLDLKRDVILEAKGIDKEFNGVYVLKDI